MLVQQLSVARQQALLRVMLLRPCVHPPSRLHRRHVQSARPVMQARPTLLAARVNPACAAVSVVMVPGTGTWMSRCRLACRTKHRLQAARQLLLGCATGNLLDCATAPRRQGRQQCPTAPLLQSLLAVLAVLETRAAGGKRPLLHM